MKMIIKAVLLIITFNLVFSKVYNVNVVCGTCQNITCPTNKCFKMTGDIKSQQCHPQSTCDFASMDVQMGLCAIDMSGNSCSSGVCLSSASSNMCYSSQGFCLNGVSYTQTCMGTTINTILSGGVYTTPFSNTIDIGMNCPFSNANGQYSTCVRDSFGSTCDCCFSMQIQGIKQMMGSCVASNSAVAKVKAQMSFEKLLILSYIILSLIFLGIFI